MDTKTQFQRRSKSHLHIAYSALNSIANEKVIPFPSNDASQINKGLKQLPIRNKGEICFIPFSKILRLEARGNYTQVYTTESDTYLMSQTLSAVCKKLDMTSFLRTHQSHLVNINFITKYIPSSNASLELEGGVIVPVSRSRKRELGRLF